MKEAVWIRAEAVPQIEFLEWTDANHLRHTKFVSLYADKSPRRVRRETWSLAIEETRASGVRFLTTVPLLTARGERDSPV
jgi:ATP-dependent DNA ligase